jgi:hypothetical protein
MIALHIPSSFARSKNRLTRALYRIGRTRVDVKKEWNFLATICKKADILKIIKTSRMIRFRLEVLATQQQGVEM